MPCFWDYKMTFLDDSFPHTSQKYSAQCVFVHITRTNQSSRQQVGWQGTKAIVTLNVHPSRLLRHAHVHCSSLCFLSVAPAGPSLNIRHPLHAVPGRYGACQDAGKWDLKPKWEDRSLPAPAAGYVYVGELLMKMRETEAFFRKCLYCKRCF